MSRRNNNDGALTFIVMVLVLIFALPIYGIYKMSKPDPSSKTIGLVLTIIGLAIWLWLALAN